MSGDRTRLPKWAQAELATLEAVVANREARIAALLAGEPSTAGVIRHRRSSELDPISPSYDGEIYPSVQFTAKPTREPHPEEGYLQAEVRLDHDGVAWLNISSGWSRLTLQCDSSNWIRVRIP